MWFRFKNTFEKFIVIFVGLNVFKGCETITNADFNAQIRDYSAFEENFNITDVMTLQKQGLALGRYANFAPIQNPIKFKDAPDSVISGSSHGRGLLHHEHAGYGFDYEEPHYGHKYEYQHDDHHDHDPHDYHYNHYDFHDSGHHHSPGHHHGYGHHHKHYDHGLATKALLWPIAGIALLGAAAALVTNPVLLQLGVVSGKRRRRHIEEIENIAKNSIRKWSQVSSDYKKKQTDVKTPKRIIKKKLRKDDVEVVKRVFRSGKGDVHFETVNSIPKRYSEEDRRFIPIPLKFNNL